eukprot:XP_011670340.1 PREDICTED: serine/threonine-protein phosphatase 6 regulatory ankyrin repeat subunit C-like [Strongylocentrotus purpuratus]
MTKNDLSKLSVFHTKSLRRICRIFWPNTISNEALYDQCHQDSMESIITRRRWRWIGHVMRKDRDDITRTALHWTPEGKRKRGRPKTTWRRTVEGEIKDLNHTWDTIQRLAQDRKEWKTFVAALCARRHNGQLYGQETVIEYLISQGADVEKATPDGQTPLHLAASPGCLKATKVILSQGANVNQGDTKGLTPLLIAAPRGKLDSQEAEVNRGDNDGWTALQIAAQNGHLDISKYLVSQGAEINGILDHRDDEGLTAIHLATQNGHAPVVESLVSHGASLNIQSNDGKTCLHEAIILSDHTISEDFYQHELSPEKALVLYLLEHGAKLDIRDGQGKLPIHYATNEDIRQIIFSRSPSIEMITIYRAEYAKPLVTVSAHVGNGGKQLELADLGISMSIPPGAVQTSCEITLTRLSIQDPPSMNSHGGESLACLGIRCDPPNMIFHYPVKIKIPHPISIINPDQVTPDIVCCSWDSVKGAFT